jgi:hypothetical protein
MTPGILAASNIDAPERFRFLNADWFGTILGVQPFHGFPLGRVRNRRKIFQWSRRLAVKTAGRDGAEVHRTTLRRQSVYHD